MKKKLLLAMVLLLPFTVNAKTLYNTVKDLSSGNTYENMADNYVGVVETTEKNKTVYTFVGARDTLIRWNDYKYASDEINPEMNPDNFAVINNICFRVLRTTYTDGVKLLYYGEYKDGSCQQTEESKIVGRMADGWIDRDNSIIESIAQAGYMYGNVYTLDYDNKEESLSLMYTPINDSSLKKTIDNWYKDNLLDYTNWFEDAIYCNEKLFSTSNWRNFRHLEDNTPTLACSKNDAYTVKNEDGNKALKYPVATLSYDEVQYTISKGKDYSWIINNAYTITPYAYDGASGGYLSMYTSDSGVDILRDEANILPTVAVNENILVLSGTGKANDPYILSDKDPNAEVNNTGNGTGATEEQTSNEEVKGETVENPQTGIFNHTGLLISLFVVLTAVYVQFKIQKKKREI